MSTKVTLFIELAKPVMRINPNGTGYAVCREGNHRANLRIGNVSLAFDGRNNFTGHPGADREMIELSEYADDPVRIDLVSCPGNADAAEKLLRALAAELDYHVEYIGNAEPVDGDDGDDDDDDAARLAEESDYDAQSHREDDADADDYTSSAFSDWQYDVANGNTQAGYQSWKAQNGRS